MACILHIDSSTTVCSVAVSEDSKVIFEKQTLEGPSHATVLAPYVDEALSFIESHAIPLDAVAISSGPGSYTGLRIGTSVAKGVVYGRNVPLIAVPTLKLITVPTLLFDDDMPEDALLVPMIDARRMEVYAAVYDRALRPLREVQPDIVTADTYKEWLDRAPVYFMGNGAEKCKTVIDHPHARFVDDAHPLAKYMAPLAEKAFLDGKFEDLAYFEPFYLKDFQASQPKKLL